MPEAAASVSRNIQYYYCDDPRCEVIYFAPEGNARFTIADLRVASFAKDTGEDVNVCYCFGWTRRRIHEEIRQTGHSTAARSIAADIKSGGCACDVKNPAGRCCLGDVRREAERFETS